MSTSRVGPNDVMLYSGVDYSRFRRTGYCRSGYRRIIIAGYSSQSQLILAGIM